MCPAFCSFGAMLFIVDMLIKNDSTVIYIPCMLEQACYEAGEGRRGQLPMETRYTCGSLGVIGNIKKILPWLWVIIRKI